jgi:death-on-curing protein
MLTVDEVRFIHEVLVREFSDTKDPIYPPGVKSETLLASAVSRQHVSLGSMIKYPDPIQNAATLTYGICCDHPFHNGNKRSALVSMLAHLDKNRLSLIGTRQKDLYKMILSVANHTIASMSGKQSRFVSRPAPDTEVTALASWINRRVKIVKRGEKQITYRELRRILNGFGYDLRNPKGNSIDVIKEIETRRGFIRTRVVTEEKRIGTIPYPRENTIVGIKNLKYVRKMCNLTEEHGVDSDAFYDEGAIINSFINQYRTILRKLARK